jgi:phage gp46-like protein
MADYRSNSIQQGDIYLFDGPYGGDIELSGGYVTMTQFIETAVYLCWFGGNFYDDGSQATEKKQWWGNDGEPKDNQYRGKLQSLLHGRPLTSALLPKIEKAAEEDVRNGLSQDVLDSVSVSASASSSKRVDLQATVLTKTGMPYTVNIGVDL